MQRSKDEKLATKEQEEHCRQREHSTVSRWKEYACSRDCKAGRYKVSSEREAGSEGQGQ